MRAGGHGLDFMSLDDLGRSSEAVRPEKVKCDQRTDGPIKRGVESRST